MSLVINPLIACVISLTLLGLHPSIQADAADRPNILFVFLDDFGWRDTGYMGSDFYETPCLDRLAKEGMTFTQAYACAANCAPSRACLLSGQYTPRHEIYNVGTGPRGQASHRRLQHIPGTKTLREDIPTWAHRLQDAGYKTATLGKWHLSQDPIPYGFDLNVGGTHAGSPPKGYYPPHGKAPGLRMLRPMNFSRPPFASALVSSLKKKRHLPGLFTCPCLPFIRRFRQKRICSPNTSPRSQGRCIRMPKWPP